MKAAKALSKINKMNNTLINKSLDLTEIERKRQKKLKEERNVQNEQLKSNIILVFETIM